jgi:hypothetical protein
MREDDNFERFLAATIALPRKIATAFEFKSAIFVFDHLDIADLVIEPGERFAGAPVPVFPLVLEAMSSVPAFVSSHTDEALFQLFREYQTDDFVHISTEHIIEAPGTKEVIVPGVELVINGEMCRGCPAYCAMLQKVCELAEQAREKTAVKSQFSKWRAIVDVSRNDLVKQEFMRLARLLQAVDANGTFDEVKMTAANALKDFSLRIR